VRPVFPTAPDLRSTANQADWLLVAPRDFLDEAQPLVEHRQTQGLGTFAVAIEDVYDAFGHGEPDPQALRDFLVYAYHHWAPPSLRYVLLLGDATFDPRDYLPSPYNEVDYIPAPMTIADLADNPFMWTASDPLYAAVNGTDTIPDIAIGRLPVSSGAEAALAVQKTLDFENAERLSLLHAVLVADDPDAGGDFEANAHAIASLLLSRPVEKIFLTEYGVGGPTNTAVMNAFNSGASLMSYIGHGAIRLWANTPERILRSADVGLLRPQPRQPLLLTWTCMTGYFIYPYSDSLTEQLVLADQRGAIAAFSPSSESMDDAAHVFHRAIVSRLESRAFDRLGDLILAAEADYIDAPLPALPELLTTYHLFGDPALKVRWDD